MLGWYNWYTIRDIGYINLSYIALFIFIIWLLIHGIDYVYQIIKGKKKN